MVDLPAPVGPTKATVSPGLDRQVDVLEHRAAGHVGERHVLEGDRPLDRRAARRRRPPRRTSGSVSHRVAQLGHRGLALLVRVVLLDQQLDGLEEPVEVEEEGDQGARRLSWWWSTMVPPMASMTAWPMTPEHLGARAVEGVDVGRVVVGVPVVADHVAVVDDVVALAVVGGHDADAVEALGQVGQHVGDPVADRS